MRTRATTVLPGLVTLGLLSACGGEDAAQPAHAARDSAGVEIVESEAPAWSEQEAWRLADTPSVSIGVVDGDPAYQFDFVAGVLRAADGRIVVADGGSRQIRIYDAAGRHVRTFGGEGAGPGEFGRIAGMVGRGDTLVVFDPAAARLSWFDLSGELLRSARMDPTGDPVHPVRMYRIGGIVEEGLVMTVRAFPADMRPEPTTYWDSIPTLLYGRDGALRDTVGEFAGMDTHSRPDRASSVTFARFTSSDVGGGRLYMTDGGTYEVRVYDPGRGLTRILRALREPRPADAGALEEYADSMRSRAETPEQRREVERRLAWPHRETLPWISGLVVDPAGRAWAEEYRHRFDDAPARWSVFDTDGRWLGRVEMPWGFIPRQVGEDWVLGVARSELGVETVRLYPLEKSG